MFRLAGKYVFESDVKTCRLSAHSGYEDGFVWDLDLQSQVQLTLYPSGSVRSSFGLQVYPPLGVLDWRELPGQSVTMCDAALERGFMFHYDMSKQWGDTLTLHLQFGQTRGPNIEVFAEGRGCIEAAQDIFPDGQAAFQIHAWAAFGGVGINVLIPSVMQLRGSGLCFQTMHSLRRCFERRGTRGGLFVQSKCCIGQQRQGFPADHLPEPTQMVRYSRLLEGAECCRGRR